MIVSFHITRRLRHALTHLLVTCLACASYHSRGSAQASNSEADLRAARTLLSRLVGTWSFEWRGSGSSGPALMTGTRTYRSLPDSLQLTWDETFDNPRQTAHGVIWYNPGTRKLLYFGLFAPTGTAALLAGSATATPNEVLFDLVPIRDDSVPINGGMVRSRLRVLPDGSHQWSRWDEGWTVTFRRRQ
jgi:hypothetical protein